LWGLGGVEGERVKPVVVPPEGIGPSLGILGEAEDSAASG